MSSHATLAADICLISHLRTNATAGFTLEQKDAATELIWPVVFEKVITVEEWAATLEKNV